VIGSSISTEGMIVAEVLMSSSITPGKTILRDGDTTDSENDDDNDNDGSDDQCSDDAFNYLISVVCRCGISIYYVIYHIV
jgi:hypothetical protein